MGERTGAFWGRERMGKVAEAAIPLCIWAKVIMYPPFFFFFFLLIAEMEFRPNSIWPERAYIRDSGVENDGFEARPLWGFGAEFSCF